MAYTFKIRNFIYRLAWPLSQLANTVSMHPMRVAQQRALEDSVDYLTAHMGKAIGMRTQAEVIRHGALEGLQVPGVFCEFGVYKAEALRFIAGIIGPSRRAHGFDSFEGLPEAWEGHNMSKGDFDVGGQLPKVPANTSLHKGWFDSSIPKWLERVPDKIAFIHIDCDLYSSTCTIFDLLKDRIQTGTVIVFDEYFNYPGWRNHEFKAFQEFVAANNVKYSYLAYGKYNVAVRIDAVGWQ
jgi:hypothetical protein